MGARRVGRGQASLGARTPPPDGRPLRAAVDRWAPWAAAVVLLGGVAAYTATRLVGGSSPAAPPAPAAAAPAAGPSVPLSPAALAVAREFVATAVARRQLARSWTLAAPSLRAGVTLAEWRTGSIPVLPYPVGKARAVYAVKSSHADGALLQVAFEPRKGSGAQPEQFLLGLERLDGRWLVSSWAPSSVVGPGR